MLILQERCFLAGTRTRIYRFFTSIRNTTRRSKKKIEECKLRKLVQDQKLVLVLDLDHTLVHCTEKESDKVVDNIFFLPTTQQKKYFLKLRPGLVQFLSSLKDRYELYVYTLASREYATKVLSLIDEKSAFFRKERIITREDIQPGSLKKLTHILPFSSSMVVILDDREDVWVNGTQNLIKAETFCYFETDLPVHATVSGELTLNSNDCYLERILPVLMDIHTEFYNGSQENRDIKDILHKFKRRSVPQNRPVKKLKYSTIKWASEDEELALMIEAGILRNKMLENVKEGLS